MKSHILRNIYLVILLQFASIGRCTCQHLEDVTDTHGSIQTAALDRETTVDSVTEIDIEIPTTNLASPFEQVSKSSDLSGDTPVKNESEFHPSIPISQTTSTVFPISTKLKSNSTQKLKSPHAFQDTETEFFAYKNEEDEKDVPSFRQTSLSEHSLLEAPSRITTTATQRQVISELTKLRNHSRGLDKSEKNRAVSHKVSAVIQLAYARLFTEPDETLQRLVPLLQKLSERVLSEDDLSPPNSSPVSDLPPPPINVQRQGGSIAQPEFLDMATPQDLKHMEELDHQRHQKQEYVEPGGQVVKEKVSRKRIESLETTIHAQISDQNQNEDRMQQGRLYNIRLQNGSNLSIIEPESGLTDGLPEPAAELAKLRSSDKLHVSQRVKRSYGDSQIEDDSHRYFADGVGQAEPVYFTSADHFLQKLAQEKLTISTFPSSEEFHFPMRDMHSGPQYSKMEDGNLDQYVKDESLQPNALNRGSSESNTGKNLGKKETFSVSSSAPVVMNETSEITESIGYAASGYFVTPKFVSSKINMDEESPFSIESTTFAYTRYDVDAMGSDFISPNPVQGANPSSDSDEARTGVKLLSSTLPLNVKRYRVMKKSSKKNKNKPSRGIAKKHRRTEINSSEKNSNVVQSTPPTIETGTESERFFSQTVKTWLLQTATPPAEQTVHKVITVGDRPSISYLVTNDNYVLPAYDKNMPGSHSNSPPLLKVPLVLPQSSLSGLLAQAQIQPSGVLMSSSSSSSESESNSVAIPSFSKVSNFQSHRPPDPIVPLDGAQATDSSNPGWNSPPKIPEPVDRIAASIAQLLYPTIPSSKIPHHHQPPSTKPLYHVTTAIPHFNNPSTHSSLSQESQIQQIYQANNKKDENMQNFPGSSSPHGTYSSELMELSNPEDYKHKLEMLRNKTKPDSISGGAKPGLYPLYLQHHQLLLSPHLVSIQQVSSTSTEKTVQTPKPTLSTSPLIQFLVENLKKPDSSTSTTIVPSFTTNLTALFQKNPMETETHIGSLSTNQFQNLLYHHPSTTPHSPGWQNIPAFLLTTTQSPPILSPTTKRVSISTKRPAVSVKIKSEQRPEKIGGAAVTTTPKPEVSVQVLSATEVSVVDLSSSTIPVLQIIGELQESNIMQGPAAFLNGTRDGFVQFVTTLGTLSFTTKMVLVLALSVAVFCIILGVYSMGPPIIAVGILGIMIPIGLLLLLQDPSTKNKKQVLYWNQQNAKAKTHQLDELQFMSWIILQAIDQAYAKYKDEDDDYEDIGRMRV